MTVTAEVTMVAMKTFDDNVDDDDGDDLCFP